MPDRFPGYAFEPLATAAALPDTTPRTLPDVEQAFRALDPGGDLLAVSVDGHIRGQRYTYRNYGDGRADIHFQGIQRAGDGVHAFITGGDSLEPTGHLFVLRLGSREGRCGWASNLVNGRPGPSPDVIARVVALDPVHWHGGGPALLGDLLAIPLEAGDRPTRTLFFDVSDPEKPLHLPALDIAGTSTKGGAAALARLADGRILCAVYRDDPKRTPIRALDLHLLDPAAPEPSFTRLMDWPFTEGVSLPRPAAYQAIAFLHPAAGGDLYLIASENTSSASPYIPGQDVVDLYRVRIGVDDRRPLLRDFGLDYVDTRKLACNGDYANLDAVGGAHVDAAGRLLYYGGFHWRVKDAVHLSEFRPRIDAAAAAIADPGDAWIELYEHRDFMGRRLALLGSQDATIPDYGLISVQGGSFNDRLSSIRYQLPPGAVYRLYEDRGFPDDRAFIDLTGDGRVHEIPELRDPPWNFADRASSSRYLPVV